MWSIQQTGHTEELYSNNLESGLLAQICWNNPKCGPGLSKLKVHNKNSSWVTGNDINDKTEKYMGESLFQKRKNLSDNMTSK